MMVHDVLLTIRTEDAGHPDFLPMIPFIVVQFCLRKVEETVMMMTIGTFVDFTLATFRFVSIRSSALTGTR